MSPDDSSKIDFVAQTPRGEALLVMVEGRPWDRSVGRLRELQEKLNTYAIYVLDGELAKQFPDLADKPVRIELRCIEPPDETAARLLDSARATLKDEGIELSVTLIQSSAS